jgi:hypothetical protein
VTSALGGGANAAWIDDVVLPMVATTTTVGSLGEPVDAPAKASPSRQR